MGRIFISYSGSHAISRELVEAFEDLLPKYNHSLPFNYRSQYNHNSATTNIEFMVKHLKANHSCLFFLASNASIRSSNCQFELLMASSLGYEIRFAYAESLGTEENNIGTNLRAFASVVRKLAKKKSYSDIFYDRLFELFEGFLTNNPQSSFLEVAEFALKKEFPACEQPASKFAEISNLEGAIKPIKDEKPIKDFIKNHFSDFEIPSLEIITFGPDKWGWSKDLDIDNRFPNDQLEVIETTLKEFEQGNFRQFVKVDSTKAESCRILLLQPSELFTDEAIPFVSNSQRKIRFHAISCAPDVNDPGVDQLGACSIQVGDLAFEIPGPTARVIIDIQAASRGTKFILANSTEEFRMFLIEQAHRLLTRKGERNSQGQSFGRLKKT